MFTHRQQLRDTGDTVSCDTEYDDRKGQGEGQGQGQGQGQGALLSQVVVMVMVATLTRPTAASPFGQEGRCAEVCVCGVEEREGKNKRERDRVCVGDVCFFFRS